LSASQRKKAVKRASAKAKSVKIAEEETARGTDSVTSLLEDGTTEPYVDVSTQPPFTPVVDASREHNANTAFAEIKMLTERAKEPHAVSGADGYGNRDVHLKTTATFSDKFKGFTPGQILRLYNKVVEFMSETLSQPGLVASEIVTSAVKEIIMAKNGIGTIAFSQMTAMDCI
jgi:hypothetical protein